MTKTKKKPMRKADKAEVVQLQEPATSQLPVIQNTPDVLIAMGIEKGMDLSQLEKLMDLQERWLERQAKSLYLQAKSDFQSEVPTIVKSKNVNFSTKDGNDAVDYYYAPLGRIADAIKPLLKKFGLSYDWGIDDFIDEAKQPKIKVTCVVSHVAGHQKATTMEGFYDASGKKNNIQSRASTVSYLQRYTLIGALGLSTDDADNDGVKAPNPPNETKIKKQPIGEDTFKKYLKRASDGEKDILIRLEDHYILSQEQREALQVIEKHQNGEAPANTANV